MTPRRKGLTFPEAFVTVWWSAFYLQAAARGDIGLAALQGVLLLALIRYLATT